MNMEVFQSILGVPLNIKGFWLFIYFFFLVVSEQTSVNHSVMCDSL